MTNKLFCIYKHTNLYNNKVYIGQTCQIPQYRWGSNGQNYKSNNVFWNDIIYYGWQDGFSHEILYSYLTLEEANILESQLIIDYKSYDPAFGYNQNFGGNNKRPTDEVCQHLSDAAKQRPIVSDNTKQKLSAINKGREKCALTKEKMSIAAIKREQNKKECHRKKNRKVCCINTGEIFNSLRAAANWCGLAGSSGIALVCQKHKQTTAGVHPITKEKLKWEYVD